VTQIAGIEDAPDLTTGEDGPANLAALNNAEDLAVAPNGDIYIADYNSARLLRISDGIMTVAFRGDDDTGENQISGVDVGDDGVVYFQAGEGLRSLSPDGTLELLTPGDGGAQAFGWKVAAAPDGSVFLANSRAPRIDRIAPDGTSTHVAGTGSVVNAIVGDGGPATEASFNRISELAVDSAGVLYVADEGLTAVRRIDPDGTISTVFGAGTIHWNQAPDGTPAADVLGGGAGATSIAVDDQDRLYICLRLGGKVYRVEDGNLLTVVGGGDLIGPGGTALETTLIAATRLAFEPNGDLLLLVEDGRKLFRIEGVGN
jgi:serine/threonine-protein kinase